MTNLIIKTLVELEHYIRHNNFYNWTSGPLTEVFEVLFKGCYSATHAYPPNAYLVSSIAMKKIESTYSQCILLITIQMEWNRIILRQFKSHTTSMKFCLQTHLN